MIIVYILLGVFILFNGISMYLLNSLLNNKLKTDEHLKNYYMKTMGEKRFKEMSSWFSDVKKEKINITSDFGYELDAYEIINDKKKFAICLHGVTTNKEFAMKFAYLYYSIGYSVILFDSRAHGKSGGKYITYGYYEKDDLKKVIDSLKEKYGEDITIGLHGESMGAGVLLTYASLVEDGCAFYVADCPYSYIYDQVVNGLKDTLKTPLFINKLITDYTFYIIKTFYHIDLKSLNIKENINKVEKPILFLNAKNDDYINPEMTNELFNNCKGNNKEVHWFTTGFHAGSFNYQPDEYIKTTKQFIDKYIEI